LGARKPEGFEARTFDARRIVARVFPLAEGGGVFFRNTT
jgi:hypothetical protein